MLLKNRELNLPLIKAELLFQLINCRPRLKGFFRRDGGEHQDERPKSRGTNTQIRGFGLHRVRKNCKEDFSYKSLETGLTEILGSLL